MSLTELRHNLEAQIREGQLPEALQALLAELPEGTETYRIVSAFIARLNAANKERFRNTISSEDYQRRVDQVSADFFDLLAGLQTSDFEEKPAAAKARAGKQGSVLYRVPNQMRVQKPTRCTIRIAVDEDVILENIVLDEHVEIKSQVEISDVMSAELLDPEGGTFQITSLNARTQLVRDTGYTEWNFNVTPLKAGEHQLLLKVSILEKVAGFAEPIPREVSLMETITILTESAAPSAETPETFKSSGQSFAFESATSTAGAYEVHMAQPAETPPPAPQHSGSRSLRPLALFLAFLVLVPAATFAIAPDLPAYVSAIIEDTPEAYTDFIQKHPDSPRLEKAYFYRAEKSGTLAYLRAYQDRYEQNGRFREKVRGRIEAMETAQLVRVLERPDSLSIHQFVADFPESERLPEVKMAVEARQENRQELMAQVESAYVRSVKAKPTEAKVNAYLRDFPEHEKLPEIVDAVASKPEIIDKLKPRLQDIAAQDKLDALEAQRHFICLDVSAVENPFGQKKGTGSGTGGGAGSGADLGVIVSGALQARAIVRKPILENNTLHGGVVSIEVCVDSEGNVTQAEYVLRGSTTSNQDLRRQSIQAAKKFKFTPTKSAKECGILRFRYPAPSGKK